MCVCLMVFNATFNNISVILWKLNLLMEETGGPGENHLTAESHWQALSHNVVHLALIEVRTHNISGSCKSRTRRPPFFFKEINMYNNIMVKLYSFTLHVRVIFIFLTLHCWYHLIIVLQHYMIKFVIDLRKVGGFLRILPFPPPRYNWNIVESGVKHHNPKQ
jgi:hypothetical protein